MSLKGNCILLIGAYFLPVEIQAHVPNNQRLRYSLRYVTGNVNLQMMVLLHIDTTQHLTSGQDPPGLPLLPRHQAPNPPPKSLPHSPVETTHARPIHILNLRWEGEGLGCQL